MWPDWVSNPGPPTYESGALLTVLRGPNWVERKLKGCMQWNHANG